MFLGNVSRGFKLSYMIFYVTFFHPQKNLFWRMCPKADHIFHFWYPTKAIRPIFWQRAWFLGRYKVKFSPTR